MPSIKSRPSLVGHARQDIFPSDWFNSSQGEADPLLALQERFAAYNEGLVRANEMAAKHVYDNRDLSLLDVRQHRMILSYYLYKADELAVDFLALRRPEEVALFITAIDEQIERLLKLFQEWHGDPEIDPEIPASFKQAMREVKVGQVAAMEDDLFAPDATSSS